MRKMLTMLLAAAMVLFTLTTALAADGQWTCPTCGRVNNDNFCSTCGTKRPEGIACPSCGAMMQEGIRYCTNCGTPLKGEASEETINEALAKTVSIKRCGLFYERINKTDNSREDVVFMGCLVNRAELPAGAEKRIGVSLSGTTASEETHLLEIVFPDGRIDDFKDCKLKSGSTLSIFTTVDTDSANVQNGVYTLRMDGKPIRHFTIQVYGDVDSGKEYPVVDHLIVEHFGVQYETGKNWYLADSCNILSNAEKGYDRYKISISLRIAEDNESGHHILVTQDGTGDIVYDGRDDAPFSGSRNDIYSFGMIKDPAEMTGYYRVYVDDILIFRGPILIEGDELPAAPGQNAVDNETAETLIQMADLCAAEMSGRLALMSGAAKEAADWISKDTFQASVAEGTQIIRITAAQYEVLKETLKTRIVYAPQLADQINSRFQPNYRALARKLCILPFSEAGEERKGECYLVLRYYPYNCVMMLADLEQDFVSAAFVQNEPGSFAQIDEKTLQSYAAALGVNDELNVTIIQPKGRLINTP